MSLFLLDTDTLSLLQWGHPAVLQQVNARPVADVAVCVLSVQEQVQGWQAAINRARTPQQLALAYDLLVVHLLPAWGRFPFCPLRSQPSCASTICDLCASISA
jgi:hypothetical protein